MKFKTVFIVGLLSLTALLVAACSSGEAPAEANATEFTVTVDNDFFFTPDTLTVTAGDEITITFDNTSALMHSFVVLTAGTDPATAAGASEDEEHEMLVMEIHDTDGGQSNTETFTAPEAGEYTIACLVPGHVDAGMVGTLVVEP